MYQENNEKPISLNATIPEIRYASFGMRILSSAIDFILFYIISILLDAFFFRWQFKYPYSLLSNFFSVGFTFTVFALFYLPFMKMGGGTIGERITKIKTISEMRNESITYKQCVMQSLYIFCAPVLGFIVNGSLMLFANSKARDISLLKNENGYPTIDSLDAYNHSGDESFKYTYPETSSSVLYIIFILLVVNNFAKGYKDKRTASDKFAKLIVVNRRKSIIGKLKEVKEDVDNIVIDLKTLNLTPQPVQEKNTNKSEKSITTKTTKLKNKNHVSNKLIVIPSIVTILLHLILNSCKEYKVKFSDFGGLYTSEQYEMLTKMNSGGEPISQLIISNTEVYYNIGKYIFIDLHLGVQFIYAIYLIYTLILIVVILRILKYIGVKI